ncbi:MAG: hypothetical protein Q3993_01865 [Filifactor alocis]|nr:hypothetical protein [Filifactor alocis]
MRDWKKRGIVAGVLFIAVLILFVVKMNAYRKEAGNLAGGRVVETREELLDALKHNGLIYAKGKIEGRVPVEDVTINNKVLSTEASDRLEGQEPFLEGDFLWLKVSRGEYEYIKDMYEQSKLLRHNYFSKDEVTLQADTLEILGVEVDVRGSENLFHNVAAEKHTVTEGSLQFDPKLKVSVPVRGEHPEQKFYSGFQVKGIYSGLEGILKLEVQDGEVVSENVSILSPSEFETVEDVRATGDVDYSVEIPTYILVWLFLTSIAWIIMRVLGY